ncbi:hypothetical protein AVEN_25303-1 [Araneus ventricosus]|uniref:Uncharacterized protein n=1 Tax=Araneus ventricosus TaxID=182803 RepID=A0A4Y2JVF8_ARAVE|nr:hypothetical protein AVEN_25303-1 [Araneus ventricosus]
MDGKQAMCSVVTTLLALAMLNVLPIGGQMMCPWCDKSTQAKLLDCVYAEMISKPELLMIPLRDIDNIKWQVASYSDSMADMPYDVKKVNVDKKFVGEMANVIKKNNYQNNHAIIDVISASAGNCYSSVTGYDPKVVTQDVKAMVKDDMRKITDPPGGNPSPEPYSKMPYSANQNQQSNFQPSRPQIQPPLKNAPFNHPGSSPVNSFGNPPFVNNAPFNPPGSSPVNSFGNLSFGYVLLVVSFS